MQPHWFRHRLEVIAVRSRQQMPVTVWMKQEQLMLPLLQLLQLLPQVVVLVFNLW